jgi:hypothetical protein
MEAIIKDNVVVDYPASETSIRLFYPDVEYAREPPATGTWRTDVAEGTPPEYDPDTEMLIEKVPELSNGRFRRRWSVEPIPQNPFES